MSYLYEVEAAERARASYGGGYCIADQAPVIVGSVRPAPETDADKIARLNRRIGELEARLANQKREAEFWAFGDRQHRLVRGCQFIEVPYDGGAITVAYEEDEGHPYPVRVWAGAWVNAENLGQFYDELERLVPDAVRAAYEASAE